jgi:hypothetical protein
MRLAMLYAVELAAAAGATALADDKGKPSIKVATNSFPSGHHTPEGDAGGARPRFSSAPSAG